MKTERVNIGVLALQGGFAEHLAALGGMPGAAGVEIRKRDDFCDDLAGLVIPGGESTAISRLLVELNLLEPVTKAVRLGLPVFATCAGLILLAADVDGPPAARIGLLDVTVKRNAYGRQQESFTAQADFAGTGKMPMVFVRAPGIDRTGPHVEPLAHVDGRIVAVRQDNMLATAFHPELTDDLRVHRYFFRMAEEFYRRSASDQRS